MLHSKKSREGYLMIDHRFSPGLPEDVARAAGYDPKLCGEGKLFETVTMTCSHCKIVVVRNTERIRPRGYCAKCDHYICDGCDWLMHEPDYIHTTFEQLIDIAISKGRLQRLELKKEVLGSPMQLLQSG